MNDNQGRTILQIISPTVPTLASWDMTDYLETKFPERPTPDNPTRERPVIAWALYKPVGEHATHVGAMIEGDNGHLVFADLAFPRLDFEGTTPKQEN